jgi:hypothetical protein
MKDQVPPHDVNLAQDYRRVEQMALFVKRQREYARWIDEMKKNIYVDIRL